MEAVQVAGAMIFCYFLLGYGFPEDDQLQQKTISSTADGSLHTSVEISGWSYGCEEDECGPSHWAELSPEWDLCKNGKQQSPINIPTSEVVPDPDTGMTLEATCENTPDTIEANFTNDGHNFKMFRRGVTVAIDNINYTMVHYTFKAPSEHTIDGVHAAFEGQILLKSESGAYAAHAWLFNFNPDASDNPYLIRFLQYLPLLHEKGSMLINKPTYFELPDVTLYRTYRYVGSLTTPPCTEGVVWTMNKRVYTISQRQQKDLLAALHGISNRPIQPSNGRPVYASFY